MTDGIERCVKKGKGEETVAACACLNLLLLQLGPGDDSEEIYQQLRPTLTTLLADKCVSPRARSAVSIPAYHIRFSHVVVLYEEIV